MSLCVRLPPDHNKVSLLYEVVDKKASAFLFKFCKLRSAILLSTFTTASLPTGLMPSRADGSKFSPKSIFWMSYGRRFTEPKCLLIFSILSTVDGKIKKASKDSVVKAPATCWILCLLNIVVLNELGIFIFCTLNKILLLSFVYL